MFNGKQTPGCPLRCSRWTLAIGSLLQEHLDCLAWESTRAFAGRCDEKCDQSAKLFKPRYALMFGQQVYAERDRLSIFLWLPRRRQMHSVCTRSLSEISSSSSSSSSSNNNATHNRVVAIADSYSGLYVFYLPAVHVRTQSRCPLYWYP